jgi:hypothetical protein
MGWVVQTQTIVVIFAADLHCAKFSLRAMHLANFTETLLHAQNLWGMRKIVFKAA